MLDFDLDMYLEDLEGLSIQEKLKSLDNLYSELEDAAAGVLSYRDGISDEFEARIKAKLNEEMQSFIAERHLEESVSKLKEGWYVVRTAHNPINIYILCSSGELRISLWLKDIYDNAKRYEMLSSIANKVGIPYKNGSDDVSLEVEEENLLPTLKDIITKLLVKE